MILRMKKSLRNNQISNEQYMYIEESSDLKSYYLSIKGTVASRLHHIYFFNNQGIRQGPTLRRNLAFKTQG